MSAGTGAARYTDRDQYEFLMEQQRAGEDSVAVREETIRQMARRAIEWSRTYEPGGIVIPVPPSRSLSLTDLPQSEDVEIQQIRVYLTGRLVYHPTTALLVAEGQIRDQLNKIWGLPERDVHQVTTPVWEVRDVEFGRELRLRVRVDNELLTYSEHISDRFLHEAGDTDADGWLRRRMKDALLHSVGERLGLA